ncbi:hypothetical protein LINPERPRIM_LOCUS13053 [Linum perenne]
MCLLLVWLITEHSDKTNGMRCTPNNIITE